MAYNILLMGASYGSLLASKLLFGGHSIHLVCLPAEADLINAEGFRVKLPVKGRKDPVLLDTRNLAGKVSASGPKEVSPTLPDWLLGSWAPAPGLDIPINGLFVLALTSVVTIGVLIALNRSRWGLRVRATVSNRTMANAIGIDTMKTDRLTFAIGCGIAGVAGAAFTTIGSTGPTSGQLYIVDSFLVVTFGGAASLLGTVVSAFSIAQTQSITEFFLAGSMAKVLTLSLIVLILMIRPQGLFASKVRR